MLSCASWPGELSAAEDLPLQATGAEPAHDCGLTGALAWMGGLKVSRTGKPTGWLRPAYQTTNGHDLDWQIAAMC